MTGMEELIQAIESMDPTELAMASGILGVMLTLILVGSAVWYFVSAIGYYKMYKKAGQRGWMAFIPLLREYVRFKFAWDLKSFWIYLVVLAVFQFSSDSENFLVSLVALVFGIALIVLKVKLNIRVAKSFGKGAGWGWLLFFFPFIVSLILGFGKAEYIGNTTAAAAPAEWDPENT